MFELGREVQAVRDRWPGALVIVSTFEAYYNQLLKDMPTIYKDLPVVESEFGTGVECGTGKKMHQIRRQVDPSK